MERGVCQCWSLKLQGHLWGGVGRVGHSSVLQSMIKPMTLSKAKLRLTKSLILERPFAFAGEIIIAWETAPKSSCPTVLLK